MAKWAVGPVDIIKCVTYVKDAVVQIETVFLSNFSVQEYSLNLPHENSK